MSVIDIVEEIENGCVDNRYRDEVLEVAREVEVYFDSFEDAASFAEAYDQEYNQESPGYDPAGYAEQWADSFEGDMSGIVDSLSHED